ncbi:unnamed protein product [Acanthoscelides obtectus]|uniref:Uncharacterized protein n=1 Tax=Acanthoscelides obtectus TaxID=200917 RepID=A0A9P0QBV0_ACAOB|nr:unnamed protein product [Acanthoscelides obtectus]CAK1684398.1 hypothetical protein AOBTE_LOCUS34849 [Acanthoscelides obtectus]
MGRDMKAETELLNLCSGIGERSARWSQWQLQREESGYYTFEVLLKSRSVGAILDSLNSTNQSNTIDLVFITYWQPVNVQQPSSLKNDIQELPGRTIEFA